MRLMLETAVGEDDILFRVQRRLEVEPELDLVRAALGVSVIGRVTCKRSLRVGLRESQSEVSVAQGRQQCVPDQASLRCGDGLEDRLSRTIWPERSIKAFTVVRRREPRDPR